MSVPFGDLLRRHRRTKGLTQAQVAERAGLSEQAIGLLERGLRNRPRLDTVDSLVTALELTSTEAVELKEAAQASRRTNRRPAGPGPIANRTPVPRQLPPTLADFTGRADELGALTDHLRSHTDRAVGLAAVTGMGGVGKTSLAVHAAHLLADEYPDGQLYLDLRGFGPGDPVEPTEAISRLLRSLGVDSLRPSQRPDDAAAWYRSHLAGLRVLIVLDNAIGAAQLRPLLPGAPGSAVIATSRRSLTVLPGFLQLALAPLPVADSVELLGRIVGAGRLSTDPPAAATISRLTGHLPLALRLIGGRIASRPHWPVDHLVRHLDGNEQPLDELGDGEAGVRSTVTSSLEVLRTSDQEVDRAAAQGLIRLGLVDTDDLPTIAAAVLLGEDIHRAERILDRLVDFNLVECPEPGRYRLHDLIRAYAREQATVLVPAADRTAALLSVLRFYTGSSWWCHRLTHPASPRLALATSDATPELQALLPDMESALIWMDGERTNILQILRQARRTPELRSFAPELVLALFGYLEAKGYWADFSTICAPAREIADEFGLDHLAVWLEHDSGIGATERGDLGTALTHFQVSIRRFRAIGDLTGQARCCSSISHVLERTRQLESAVEWANEALAISQQVDDQNLEGVSYLALGRLHNRLGDLVRAERAFNRAIAIAQAAGNMRSMARRHLVAGTSYLSVGRGHEAVASIQRSVTGFAKLTDPAQAEATCYLAIAYLGVGDLERAERGAREALELARVARNRQHTGRSLIVLGRAKQEAGDEGQARELWTEAIQVLHGLSTSEEDLARAYLAGDRSLPFWD